MSDKIIENNQVTIMGEIASDFTFSHEVFGEGFYMVEVKVKRLSNSEDRIPLMISERLIDVTRDYTGEYIMVNGQFRSYNRHEEQKNRLVLSVFVRELEFIDEELDGAKTNSIFLDGYICKLPVYRKTPLGREIADLLLAVNRPYGKSDYIPCICWGRNARYASAFEVGEHRRNIMAIFTGSGVALVTPFHEDESINYDKLDEMLDYPLYTLDRQYYHLRKQQVNPLLYQKKSTWNASNLQSSVSREESR